MRYLATGTAKQISKIGLGTWQFGSKEWGYGQPYAEQGRTRSCAAPSIWA